MNRPLNKKSSACEKCKSKDWSRQDITNVERRYTIWKCNGCGETRQSYFDDRSGRD